MPGSTMGRMRCRGSSRGWARALDLRRPPVLVAAMTIAARLAELGIELPAPAAPVAAYVPVVDAAGLLHVSGQLPFAHTVVMNGQMGEVRVLVFRCHATRDCQMMIISNV